MRKTIIENGLEHILVGDYFLPNLALPEEHRPIGKWGRLHREYLKQEHPVQFESLILNGRLWAYLADLNEQAQERILLITEQLKAAEDVSEKLKAADPMAWVGVMNSICNRAEEIVLHELVYGENAV